jgi:hypothetical protein
MKIGLIKYLRFSILLSLAACHIPEQKLDGAYQSSINDSDHIITIFKNGYWIKISSKGPNLLNCSGGTFIIKENECIQTFDFNTLDSLTVRTSDTFKFSLSNTGFVAQSSSGNVANKDYRMLFTRIKPSGSITNESLEGVWKLKPRRSDEAIRIFSYPEFIRVYYNPKLKTVEEIFSGTYHLEKDELVETIEHTNSEGTWGTRWGTTSEWEIKKLSDDEIQMFDIDSFYDEEIWDHIN